MACAALLNGQSMNLFCEVWAGMIRYGSCSKQNGTSVNSIIWQQSAANIAKSTCFHPLCIYAHTTNLAVSGETIRKTIRKDDPGWVFKASVFPTGGVYGDPRPHPGTPRPIRAIPGGAGSGFCLGVPSVPNKHMAS